MKRSFQILGILTLLLGSYIYTDEVLLVSKTNDNLLTEIQEKKELYKQKPIQPIIKGDTIIPGIDGQEIDVQKSYQKMRQIGYFSDKLLVYKPIHLKETLINNKDKYIISGNQNKKNITIMFKFPTNQYLDQTIQILNTKHIQATFLIDAPLLEQNYNTIINLITNGHTIGNLSKNENYSHSDFVWLKTIITNTGNQKYNYCYTEKKKELILNNCEKQKSYTIIPTSIIKDRPYINIKNNLKKGAIISLYVDNKTIQELPNIINYILGKGYKIVSLEKLLEEGI